MTFSLLGSGCSERKRWIRSFCSSCVKRNTWSRMVLQFFRLIFYFELGVFCFGVEIGESRVVCD